MIRPALIAAALLLAALPIAAFTQGPPAQNRLNVALHGRDLATAEGARGYYRDLAKAAIKVCDRLPAKGELWAIDKFDTCLRTTLGAAVADAHAPLVSALYQRSQAYAELASR